jgi:hypothetical protein
MLGGGVEPRDDTMTSHSGADQLNDAKINKMLAYDKIR